MKRLKYSKSIQWNTIPFPVIAPLSAGIAMLIASLLPWLTDPLGQTFSAWQLPVNLGWPLPTGLCSYGLLCLLCACSAFFIAMLHWRQHRIFAPTTRRYSSLASYYLSASLCCLVPLLLFIIQYLAIDMGMVGQLTRHEIQALLIKVHFDYGVAAPFVPIQPPTINPLTLDTRVALLLDQIGKGVFFPLLSTLILFTMSRSLPRPVQRPTGKTRRLAVGLGVCCALLLMVLLGRGPVALACNEQAQHLLAIGDYAGALQWLDRAERLNPSLDQLSYYHIERGQAWYFLHPGAPNADSQVYLAAFYRQQNDFLSSYQELLTARQNNPQFPWIVDELDLTLARTVESTHPLTGAPALRLDSERPLLPWLDALVQEDPTNVYGHYMLGRFKYDLHDYAGTAKEMLTVIQLSHENNIQSSAYTYLALSSMGQGDDKTAREYLFKAQSLDPEYFNNTAREELSGLR